MTSEVVVMNRLGIALASDSASTVHMGDRTKFYHADKLFMLSNHQPVGIMVFNNSTLLGVPWETIIKLFRANFGESRLDYLSQYGTKLIEFLNSSTELFPEEIQHRHYLLMLDNFFRSLVEMIDKEADLKVVQVARTGKKPKSDYRDIEARIVQDALAEWQSKEDVDGDQCEREVANLVVGSQSGAIHQLILKHFQYADQTVMTSLYELSRLLICKKAILLECLSGIVIAGFGDREHFPAMEVYDIGEIYRGRLKYTLKSSRKITGKDPAVIEHFAQSDMASTFLDGVSPAFRLQVVQEVIELAVKLPNEVVASLPIRGKAKKAELKELAQRACLAEVEELIKRLDKFKQAEHLTPILRSIEYLPKDELAHVAASLVNLNSLQKRISFSEEETVGGPIDVAVISKGDGFIWIDRKHYFKPELNRHFFRNRMEEGSHPENGENHEDRKSQAPRHISTSGKIRSRATSRENNRK